MNETPASTGSNLPVNPFGEGKAMLKHFVHDALTEIGSDSTMDELLLCSPFDDDQPTLAFQQHEDSELSTGIEHAACTQSITETRELIEEQNREYNEALKADQQKEHEIEKEQENAREMEQLRREIVKSISVLGDAIKTENPKVVLTFSEVVTRNDGKALADKVNLVNEHLNKLCTQRNWGMISHKNIKNIHFNGSGIHLNRQGSAILARNIKTQLLYNSTINGLDNPERCSLGKTEGDALQNSLKTKASKIETNFNYPKLKGFKVGRLNIASLPKHTEELKIFLNAITFDILCINETRLNSLIENRLVEIPGYDIVRRDRNRHGGGVAIYIRNNLVYINRNDIMPDILEAICIEVKKPRMKPLLVCSWYRAPDINSGLNAQLSTKTTYNYTNENNK